jgi:hypothetical protein
MDAMGDHIISCIEENCGESGDGEFLGGKNFIEGYDDFFFYF